MNPSIRLSRLITCLGGFAVVLLMTAGDGGCKVKKPVADDTPPTLTWRVLNLGTGSIENYPQNKNIQAKLGSHYQVIMIGADTKGVHQLTLGWHAAYNCNSIKTPFTDGDVTTSVQQVINAPPTTRTFEADANGYVLTEIPWVTEAMTFNYDCGPDKIFSVGGPKFTGTVENYGGKTTTGVLDINVTP